MGFSFVFNWRRVFIIVYFLGIGGALQAVITPDGAEYAYPHFRFFDSLLSHSALVVGGLWVVVVEGIRPTFRSLIRVFAGLNLYAFVIFFVNTALGSNYLFVNGKPDAASAMDAMPEWPWYLLILEVLAFGLFTLMVVSFRKADQVETAALSNTSA